MKKVISMLLLCSTCSIAAQAQTLVLHVNGDMPDSVADKTGNNTMNNINSVYIDNGALAFGPGINSYLSTDSLDKYMAINQDWTFECRVMVSDSTDEVALIDFRSTSQTGNMYLYYNRNGKGLHFSDRNLNGDAGHLVADYMTLPENAWVTVKLEKANGHLKIYRDGIATADTTFTDTLSPIATTTIGYSEDRRETHDLFWMDDIKIWSGVPNSVGEVRTTVVSAFPNPARGSVTINTDEAVRDVVIYELTGKRVLSSASKTISIDQLAPGNYFFTLHTKRGDVQTGSFIRK